MSTPDPNQLNVMVVPGEARPAVGHTPMPTHAAAVPTNNVPTPGLATAILRVPGAPTLPEWDPVSMSVLIQKLANEQYAAPPVPMDGDAKHPLNASPASLTHAQTPGALPTSSQSGMAEVAPIPSHSGRGVGVRENPLPAAPSTSAAPSMPSSPSAVPSAPPSASEVPGGSAAASSVGAPTSPHVVSGAAPAAPTSARSLTPTPLPEGEGIVSPFSTAPNFDALFAPHAAFSIPLDGFGSEVSAPVRTADQQPRLLREAEPTPPTSLSAPRSVEPKFPASAGFSDVAPQLAPTRGAFAPYFIKREFPILDQQVNGRQLVWLDNAATTQKPRAVIDRLSKFYERENSNIHRAAHTLAARATDAYETARETVRRFINAGSNKEIVFVRGTTEGINLVAQSWGRRHVQEGDEIVITHLEHHANIVPWQMLCAEKNAKLRVAPVDDTGQIILEEYEKLLGPKTRLVSLTQVSNALGTITPAKEMVELAHRHGAKVLVDGAQAVSHLRVDMQSLDCDFFVFSGHKIFAPTGIGVVYGKQALLDAMPPWQGGGNMISDVTFEKTQFHPAPQRFEAGTGNIADAVGLGAALDWVSRVGLENIAAYEHELLEYATLCLREVPGLTLYGTSPDKAGVLSFTLAGQKTETVGGLLDREGIAVRSGHHCAQPILRRFGLEATVRASLAPYNTREDVDALVAALKRIQQGGAS